MEKQNEYFSFYESYPEDGQRVEVVRKWTGKKEIMTYCARFSSFITSAGLYTQDVTHFKPIN